MKDGAIIHKNLVPWVPRVLNCKKYMDSKSIQRKQCISKDYMATLIINNYSFNLLIYFIIYFYFFPKLLNFSFYILIDFPGLCSSCQRWQRKTDFSLCETLEYDDEISRARSETRSQVGESEGKAFPEQLPQFKFLLQPSAYTGSFCSCLVPRHLLSPRELHCEDLRMFSSPRTYVVN